MSMFASFRLSDLSDHAAKLFENELLQAAATIVVAILIQLFVRDLIGRVIARSVKRHRYTNHFEEAQRIKTLTNVLRAISAITIWLIAAIVILSQFHVNLAALLTGAGLVSVVVGFGAQSMIKDFLGGLFIILENQYRIDDIVTLQTTAGQTVSGAVEDISLRVTKLRDLDGKVHWVSNGSSTVVTNASSSFANVNINIHVDYTADIDKVEKVANAIGEQLAKEADWANLILEPIQFLWVKSFDDYAVTVNFLGKVRPGRQYDVASEFRRRLLPALKEHDIRVPLAQVVTLAKPKSSGSR